MCALQQLSRLKATFKVVEASFSSNRAVFSTRWSLRPRDVRSDEGHGITIARVQRERAPARFRSQQADFAADDPTTWEASRSNVLRVQTVTFRCLRY